MESRKSNAAKVSSSSDNLEIQPVEDSYNIINQNIFYSETCFLKFRKLA
jgi:hypothetical protein